MKNTERKINTKIKICGLKRLEDIEYVNLYNPDFVGFVFAKSSRQVDDVKAQMLKENLNKNIKSVGVFVDDDIEHITKLVNSRIIDLVQIHGNECDEYIIELKSKINVPIIKAIRLKEKSQLEVLNKQIADFYLIDAYSDNEYGGTGKIIDENLIDNKLNGIFLAGGINVGNVEEMIKKFNPYCVDVSSGVETNGIKDKKKIKEIIKKVREI